jgi:hypothetical protein
MPKEAVPEQIENAVQALTKRPDFEAWIKGEKIAGDGLVLINNSFIYRQNLKTNKSPYYLAVPVAPGGTLDTKSLKVAEGLHINNDLRFVKTGGKAPLVVEELAPSIDRELGKLGAIVMVLIGEVDNSVKTSEAIPHSLFSQIVLDPASTTLLSAHEQVITIQSVADDEALWAQLEKAHGAALPDDFAQPFATAIENVRKRHYAILKLPGRTPPESPLLDSFVAAFQDTVRQYEKSLKASRGLPTPRTSDFNDLLRIAYNFASDAVHIIRLLVSLCDLKPIIRWCTIDEWFRLADAFRSLPWSKLKQKPSLDAYQQTINAARNRAFHRLLPVDNTLRVDLEGKTLGIVTLHLFPEYLARRTEETIEYEDKALVEILTDFTRVGERSVSPQFWTRNLAVMKSTTDLLTATSSALKLLAIAQ